MRLATAFVLAAAASVAACRGPASPKAPGVLLEYVPADTPYALVVLDPAAMSASTSWAHVDRIVAALHDNLVARRPSLDEMGGDHRFLAELFFELGGRFNTRSLARLGIDEHSQAVLYGWGLAPVLRIHLDGAAFQAAIDRAARRARYTLPVRKRGNRSYYAFALDKVTLLAVVGPGEVTLALARDPEPLLPHVVGDERPATSLAATGALGKLAARWQMRGDTAFLLDPGQAAAHIRKRGPGVDALIRDDERACAEAIAGAFGDLPRMTMFGDASKPDHSDAVFAFELGADRGRRAAGAVTAIPRWPADRGAAKLLVGLGVRPMTLIDGLAGWIDEISPKLVACGSKSDDKASAGLAPLRMSPLPQVTGATVAVRELDLDKGKFGVAAVIALPDPVAVWKLLGGFISLPPPKSGPPVAVEIPGVTAMLGPVHLALGDGLIGASLGAGGDADLAALLAAPPGPKAPFVMVGDGAFLAVTEARADAAETDLGGKTPEEANLRKAMRGQPSDFAHLGDFKIEAAIEGDVLVVRMRQEIHPDKLAR